MKNLFLVIILINGISWTILHPYIQHTANQHMSMASFFEYIYYTIGTLLAVYSSYLYFKRRQDISFLLLSMVVVGSLVFWGYSFSHIYCLRCAASG